MRSTVIPLTVMILCLFIHPAFAQVTLIDQSFDAVIEPDLPLNWVGEIGWATSSSSASSGSGANNLSHTGSTGGDVALPALNFSQIESGTVSYLARRTSSYDQSALVLEASTDDGASFAHMILTSGEALPGATSTYVLIEAPLPDAIVGQSNVILRFAAGGGSSSGSNIRIDDLVVSGTPTTVPPTVTDSTVSSSTFGFPIPGSTVLEESQDIQQPLALHLNESIRGLQFDLSYPVSLLSLDGIDRGAVLADTSVWSVEWNQNAVSTRIVILSKSSSIAPPGVYDSFVTLRFKTFPLQLADSVEAAITISGVIGAFSGESGVVDGEIGGQHEYGLTILKRTAEFKSDASEVDFGSIPVNTVLHKYVRISNETGNRDLTISDIQPTNSLFTAEPSTLVIHPAATDSIRINYSPTFTDFGFATGELQFIHDGSDSGASTIALSGIGVGGRGDVNADGAVDVGDVLVGIDAVLGITALPSETRSTIDVFPTFLGDASIDIRDLSVVVEAILSRAWSDGIMLPESPGEPLLAPMALSTNAGKNDGSAVSLEFERKDQSTYVLWLRSERSLRGIELSIPSVSGARLLAASTSSFYAGDHPTDPALIRLGSNIRIDPKTSTLRMLLALSTKDSLPPGRYAFARIEMEPAAEFPNLGYGVAFGEDLQRMNILSDVTSTATTQPTQPEITAPLLDRPFPNPWKIGSSSGITVPFRLSSGAPDPSISVYDLLGRSVHITESTLGVNFWTWNPEPTDVHPGIYFIHMTTDRGSTTQSLFIVR